MSASFLHSPASFDAGLTVAPLSIEAMNQAHASASRAWYGNALRLDRLERSDVRAEWSARLERAGLNLHVQIGGESACLSIEDFAVPPEIAAAWAVPMPERHRLALVEDTFAALLDRLEHRLGSRLLVSRVERADMAPLRSALFGEWIDDKGAAVRFCWTGAESTITQCLLRLHASRTSKTSHERLAARSLPLTARLQLRCGAIHVTERAALRVGAAVLIPNATGPLATAAVPVALVSALRGRGRRTLARGVIRGRQLSFLEAFPMRHDASTSDLEPPDAGADLDQLPMLVTCEVGRLEMTIADLADLAPGMVVDLQAPLANLRGTLCVQGRPVAQGELVGVGSDVALRITSMLTTRTE